MNDPEGFTRADTSVPAEVQESRAHLVASFRGPVEANGAERVEFFGGAIALNYHREPRSTLDVDINI